MANDCRQEAADFLIIPRRIFDEMLAHCRQGYPNEACGILAGKDNGISKLYTLANVEDSPVSYMMDSSEQFRVMKDIRLNALSMVAIFHSHPSSPAYPSAKDVSLAFYEDCVYIIASLMETTPVVKGFSVREGEMKEISLVVNGAL